MRKNSADSVRHRYIAGNTMVEAVNARSLGWKARAPGFFETLRESDY